MASYLPLLNVFLRAKYFQNKCLVVSDCYGVTPKSRQCCVWTGSPRTNATLLVGLELALLLCMTPKITSLCGKSPVMISLSEFLTEVFYISFQYFIVWYGKLLNFLKFICAKRRKIINYLKYCSVFNSSILACTKAASTG